MAKHESMKKETRDVRVALGGPELLQKGGALADLNDKINKLDMDRKKYASNIASQIKVLQQSADKLGQEIREKKELRNVECQVIYDWDKGIKEYKYDGNKVDECPISEEERQTSLDSVI
jgi:Mor family transcriptional regulator